MSSPLQALHFVALPHTSHAMWRTFAHNNSLPVATCLSVFSSQTGTGAGPLTSVYQANTVPSLPHTYSTAL